MYTLNDICSVITDGSHFSPEDEGEGYPMLSVKDMGERDFDFTACKYVGKDAFQKLLANGCKPEVNDVVVAKDGSYLKTAFPIKEDRDIALLSSIAILRPRLEIVSPDYLSYFLKSSSVYRTVSLNYISGTALKRVILKGIKKIPVKLPTLEEQRYRVNLLDSVYRIIQQRNEQLVGFDNLIKARFVEMFGSIKEEQLLGGISEFVTVGIANSATHAYAESGIPMLRNQNIRENHLDDTDLIYIKPEFAAKYESKKLKENDIIAMRTGYPGIACLVPKKYEGCQTFTTLIVRLKPGNNPSYVCSYINSDLGKRFIDSGKVGVAQQNFGAKSLAKMPIKIASKELQDKYADFVKQVEKSKSRKKLNYITKNRLAS